ncbi:MAG: hypothetical protein HYX24_07440 [Candidatus Aenigmarchaeota archaeon]|nr:hypothetical protein [Candidatus Aenigmarchaeota archaeon]
MLPREIDRIMKENRRYTEMLEYYDRTGKFPLGKTRRSFTLKEMSISKLKEVSKKSGKSMSSLLDMLIENYLKNE